MTRHTIINIQQIRDDICKRKAMPPFGPDTSINRLKTINETQRSFTLEVVELLLGEIDVLSKSEWTLADELVKAQKRIAELEARKFKVEMPESFYPDGDIDAPLAVDELEVIAAIVAAGGKPVAFCKRCDREIDLTHRPDGSHYCHVQAAGIGVKGDE